MAERATALVLAPAMALVLIAVGAIGVDLVVVHAAQRSLYRTVSAAADDAAGMIDARGYQQDGVLRIDPDEARRVVEARLEAADLPGPVSDLTVTTTETSVEVRARLRVPHVFLGVVPGVEDVRTVPVRVRARLER